jgi:hypothetical protein
MTENESEIFMIILSLTVHLHLNVNLAHAWYKSIGTTAVRSNVSAPRFTLFTTCQSLVSRSLGFDKLCFSSVSPPFLSSSFFVKDSNSSFDENKLACISETLFFFVTYKWTQRRVQVTERERSVQLTSSN